MTPCRSKRLFSTTIIIITHIYNEIKLTNTCIFVSTTRRRHDTRSVGHFGRHHHFNCTISQTLSHRIGDRKYIQIFFKMAHYVPIFVHWSRWYHSPRSIFNIKSCFISQYRVTNFDNSQTATPWHLVDRNDYSPRQLLLLHTFTMKSN